MKRPVLSAPVRVKLMGLVLLVVTFAAGALAGAAFDRTLVANEARRSERGEPGARERRLLDDLQLVGAQRAQVEAILDRRRAELDAFWEEAGPRLRMIVDSARAEVRAALTAEQRAEYDRLRAERLARKNGRHHQGGPPGPVRPPAAPPAQEE
jgi:Spy/CpxP family protein refolding chaperone